MNGDTGMKNHSKLFIFLQIRVFWFLKDEEEEEEANVRCVFVDVVNVW